ncbi:MAG: methylmalonyl Co-A mutase-associated GTPase MeaB [Calditrichaeota bacterium]|nr:MAG: methylmalonyl Co-A mutase-associated GTPase MeaB [Calditrichota bacterium]
MRELIEHIRSRDRRAIARCMSLIENQAPEAAALLDQLYPFLGQAYRIGITGPPGAGKSTLTAALTRQFRQQGRRVGIVAVDPTSPFTGGALLGDRIRMSEFATDPEVFVRSMASRGSTGGLAERAQEVADVLDVAGYQIILLETVGVGQMELDIADAADTTVVVLVPESGDSVQAMKAGLMEIADLFVVNKADREGAEVFARDLRLTLHLRSAGESGWEPPILQTVATAGKGIETVFQKVLEHRAYLEREGLLEKRRTAHLEKRLRRQIEAAVLEQFWTPQREARFQKEFPRLVSGKITPRKLLKTLLKT